MAPLRRRRCDGTAAKVPRELTLAEVFRPVTSLAASKFNSRSTLVGGAVGADGRMGSSRVGAGHVGVCRVGSGRAGSGCVGPVVRIPAAWESVAWTSVV